MWIGGIGGGLIYFGYVSSIHLLGLFETLTRPPAADVPSESPSAKRPLCGRAGQGSIVDADTVTTVAINVKAKSDDTNVRCPVNRSAL